MLSNASENGDIRRRPGSLLPATVILFPSAIVFASITEVFGGRRADIGRESPAECTQQGSAPNSPPTRRPARRQEAYALHRNCIRTLTTVSLHADLMPPRGLASHSSLFASFRPLSTFGFRFFNNYTSLCLANFPQSLNSQRGGCNDFVNKLRALRSD